jgi:hypothetical protein
MSWIAFSIMAALVVSLCMAIEIVEQVRVRKLLDRPCAGIRWVRRFPDAPKAEIRAFLHRFAEAFAFEERDACKFTPDEQIAAIYSARYDPLFMFDDRMEYESLADTLKRHYAIDLHAVWRDDITLGELFTLALAS